MARITLEIDIDELITKKEVKVDDRGRVYIGRELCGEDVTILVLKRKKPAEASP